MPWTFIGRRWAPWAAVLSLLIIQIGCSKTPPPSELAPLGDAGETGPVNVDEFVESAGMGMIDEVLASLDQGVDIHATNASGRTALMEAAFFGRRKVVEILLDRGARIDQRDQNGRTALQYAATGPYAGTVRLLLENGAEVNVTDTVEGFTALMFAAGEGQHEVVKVLLEFGADPTIKDVDGDTALSFAIQKYHTAVAELLSAQPAETDQPPAGERQP